jgi:hypothetical protein
VRRYPTRPTGDVAEWLRSGLQSRLHRFDSGRRLLIAGQPRRPLTGGVQLREGARGDQEQEAESPTLIPRGRVAHPTSRQPWFFQKAIAARLWSATALVLGRGGTLRSSRALIRLVPTSSCPVRGDEEPAHNREALGGEIERLLPLGQALSGSGAVSATCPTSSPSCSETKHPPCSCRLSLRRLARPVRRIAVAVVDAA